MGKVGIKDLIGLAVVAAAGYAAVFALSNSLERSRPQLPDGYVDSDLTVTGGRLRGYAFGAEGLLADYYFMRSLQYVGDKILQSNDEKINLDDLRGLNPRLLYPMLNTATDLDPHFVAAYSYGAVVLPAIDAQNAIDLATKGIDNNPDQWRLYQQLGYIYWRLGQFDKAAEFYDRGSQIQGAPPFMKTMAASMLTKGGSRDTARSIFQNLIDISDDAQVRITARRRLAELDSLDERQAIDKVLSEQKRATGRCPISLSEIIPTLQGVDLPNGRDFRVDRANRLVDPTDAAYLLDRDKCRIMLDAEKTALPLK